MSSVAIAELLPTVAQVPCDRGSSVAIDLRVGPPHVERLHARPGRSLSPPCARDGHASDRARQHRRRRRARDSRGAGRDRRSRRAYRTAPSPTKTTAGRDPADRATRSSVRRRIADGGRLRARSGAPGSNSRRRRHLVQRANTSRRCASIQAADELARRRVCDSPTCASASSADTPTIRRPVTNASPCIVAMPMRRPVNDPGRRDGEQIDVRQRDAVRGERRRAIRRAAARRACATDRRAARRQSRSSSTSATLPARVVVSRASTRMR